MRKKILVIDDDALVLKSLENLLSREGYKVECARNGVEAKEKLRSSPAHLIICDIRMPDEDGIHVIQNLKRICQEEIKSELPFMFITGYASEEAPIDAIKLGAKDYILKPFDLNELVASVRHHIG